MQAEDLYNTIAKNLPNFNSRNSQLQMVKIIDQCFSSDIDKSRDGRNICLIDAPTGTGKSLAYLISGVVNSKRIGKKFVISTVTKSLQSQLVDKDIPSMLKHSGIEFSFCLAKGRKNYLCPYQLDLSLTTHITGDLLDHDSTLRNKLKEIKLAFDSKKWDGDLDTSPISIDSSIRPLITIDKDSCLGYSCAYNLKNDSICPFYQSRAMLRSCDVIVTNHSLLLADLAIEGGILAVCPDDYLLCIDEGHNFADSAISSFTASFEIKKIINSCYNLSKLVHNPQNQSYIFLDIALCAQLVEDINDLVDSLDRILVILEQNIEIFVEGRLILNNYLNTKLSNEFQEIFINVAIQSSTIYATMHRLINKLKEQIKTHQDRLVEVNLNKIGFYLSLIENVMSTAQYIINQDDSSSNANVRWIDIETNKNITDYVVHSGLTYVGKVLFDKLWSKVYSAIITSATLAINQQFNYNLKKLGLNLYPDVKTYALNTTFVYAKQAQIVVPKFKNTPDFANKTEFEDELATYLNIALDYNQSYGTLVLFFNRMQLLQVYSKLSKHLHERILKQTDYTSNQFLLAKHKRNILDKMPSVIFGLNSFAEGVDLPSVYCMHVIITKLPFDVHKDPYSLVQQYWINFEKNSYFNEIALPEACVRLIQATGRLIRNENDYGQVTICDKRIITKNYGSVLLDALPPFNRKYNAYFISEHFAKIVGDFTTNDI